MAKYQSDSFREHHLTRLPILNKLLELGWKREQIICPSPNSTDTEWRIPKTPSEASKRELGRSFNGFPVDIAIFDSVREHGEYEHLQVIIECKAPNKKEGINQLKIYLSMEPHAKLGVWSNGTEFVRVYKLPKAGEYKIIESSYLPKKDENFILADEKRLVYDDLEAVYEKKLEEVFSTLLEVITSRDSLSTRREEQLNQMSNILLLKLDSDNEGQWDKNLPLNFQLESDPYNTSSRLNEYFTQYKNEHPTLFSKDEGNKIVLDTDTIQEIVLRLQRLNIGNMAPAALSIAFQVFRDASLKLGDGQYYTPLRVIETGVKLMEITHKDMVIDPACGTGGFLSEAMMTLAKTGIDDKKLTQWAHYKLFGVDRDKTNVKLTRALMVGIGDGSTNIHHGDSLRESKWEEDFNGIQNTLKEGRYSVVLTNPPFGKGLVINKSDAKFANLEICKHTKTGKKSLEFADKTELGIAFVERSWRLLQNGGRLGIILPETYFFSKSYSWFREWIDEHFILRAALNVPMEAFQGFCRAKTNFYIFEKKGDGPKVSTRPKWYKDGYVWISNAPTIGVNKDGHDLFIVNSNGERDTRIDNKANADVEALLSGNQTKYSRYVPSQSLSDSYIAVPTFSGNMSNWDFEKRVQEKLPSFKVQTLGDLIDARIIEVRTGHGSPSADTRIGDIPYIKVVDLRAGRVNPNSTNMVPKEVAKKFWKSDKSGLKPWDIITPARASKNIGEPCMLLPGQEELVVTKEVLIFSTTSESPFDQFYLFWALNLEEVRKQWEKVIFMQTNREDLGDRYRYIEIPFSNEINENIKISNAVREYFIGLDELNKKYKSMSNTL